MEQNLKLISELVRKDPRRRLGLYRCVCGNIKEIRMEHVNNNDTKSCGCLSKAATALANTKHGYTRINSNRVEWNAYKNAYNRCTNPKVDRYPSYGGKGVEFRFKSFQEFIDEVGPKPSPELSLDRINPFGHYEVGNVRWADKETQYSNMRRHYR